MTDMTAEERARQLTKDALNRPGAVWNAVTFDAVIDAIRAAEKAMVERAATIAGCHFRSQHIVKLIRKLADD